MHRESDSSSVFTDVNRISFKWYKKVENLGHTV